jgi:hypothetical protein
VSRGTRGNRDQEGRWLESRQRAARALIADPDIFFYLAYLSSNKARKMAIDLSGLLGDMILAAEGRRLPQSSVPAGASQGLQQMAGILVEVVSQEYSPSELLLEQIKRESSTYTNQYLLPNIRTGGRLQPKGAEAAGSFSAAKTTVETDWPRMFEYIRALRFTNPLPMRFLRPEALKVPADSLQRTAALEYPPEKACAYTLQLLAGVSAVEAMNRPVDSFVRLQVSEGESLPAKGYTFREAGETGGFITSFEILDAAGSVVDPRRLGIRAKDFVQWLGGTATVSAVGPSVTLLTDSDIPTGTRAIVSVESGAGRVYKTMRTKVNDCLSVMPTTRQLTEALGVLEGTGAPETQKMVKFLAETANFLHPLGEEPLKTLERMNLEVESTPTLSDALLEYSPVFAGSTKNATNDLLDTLQADGFDLAVRYLIQGNLEDFLFANAQTASFGGRFDYASRLFSSALSTREFPSVSGR